MATLQQQVQVVSRDQNHPQVQQIHPQVLGEGHDLPQVTTTEQIYMEVTDLEMAPDKNTEGPQQFAVS